MGWDRPAHAACGRHGAAAEELANARGRAGAEPECPRPPRGIKPEPRDVDRRGMARQSEHQSAPNKHGHDA